MENIHRVVTALGYRVIVSFTSSVSDQCQYFLAIVRFAYSLRAECW